MRLEITSQQIVERLLRLFENMRNIEIKATVDDIDVLEKKVKELSDSPLVVIKQHDTFFCLPSDKEELGGRYKMRKFEDGSGMLVYYERPNTSGPKLSSYSLVSFDKEKLKEVTEILTLANGVKGIVEKIRHLYMVGQTRIHLDRVSGLGNFMEFEVVLNETDEISKGKEIADDLMKKLGIKESSLLTGAYLDIIQNKK